MTPADRYLWTLPMFHANGWTFTWIVTAVGGTHVCLRKVDASSRSTQRIQRERSPRSAPRRRCSSRSRTARRAARKQLRRGVRLLTAGAPPAAATIERIEGELGWTVTQVYGLTETAPFISICEPLPEHDELGGRERAVAQGAPGRGADHLRRAARGRSSSMRDVPRDGATVGEIVARGNVVMQGYFNDPEATAQAFAGGWFHSGDAAVVHPDGYVEIRDRFKDVIISGGENISSIEVEGALLRHPAVLEVAVVGAAAREMGRVADGVRRAARRRHPPPKTSCASSRAACSRTSRCRARSSSSTALPKTATGKIQKYVLRGGKAAHRAPVAPVTECEFGSDGNFYTPNTPWARQG